MHIGLFARQIDRGARGPRRRHRERRTTRGQASNFSGAPHSSASENGPGPGSSAACACPSATSGTGRPATFASISVAPDIRPTRLTPARSTSPFRLNTPRAVSRSTRTRRFGAGQHGGHRRRAEDRAAGLRGRSGGCIRRAKRDPSRRFGRPRRLLRGGGVSASEKSGGDDERFAGLPWSAPRAA